jgi:hypothetical protein
VFFVVGKNYRLQDIQLSKNASEATGCQLSASSQRRPLARQLLSKFDPGEYHPSGYFSGLGVLPPDPLARSTRGAQKPRSVSLAATSNPTPSSCLSQARPAEPSSEAFFVRGWATGPQPRAKAGGLCNSLIRGWAMGPQPRGKGRRPLQSKRSGEYRARTGDLLVANQALSQLS